MMTLRPPEAVNLHGTDTGREALSHSRIGVLLACEQKFYWSYEQRLEPAVKKASLSMGAAFAHALEHADPKAGCDLVLEEQAALVEEYGSNPWITLPGQEDAEIAGATVLAAAGAYLAHYGHTDVQREITMRARIRNPVTGAGSRTFDVQARIDGLAANDLLIEDKFVGRVDQITERRLMLDRQVTIGCYLHWRTTSREIRQVSYRLTKKPSIRRKQTESHDEFLERLIADYQERPEFYLHEFTLTRTPEDYLRLEAELWRWSEQVRDARRDGVFPRNTSACADFGGCQFLSLCCREPGADHQFVERETIKEVITHAA